MEITPEAILQEMKLRPNIKPKDIENDSLLLSYINETIEKVKNYCNRKKLPITLFYTIIGIAIDLYEYRSTDSKAVISETQGSRSMTYAGKDELDSIITGYAAILNRYRRIKVV